MADVSGFTALSERYNNAGKAGTYQLTAILNTYLGSLIEVVYSYGGDIIKFAGDAFLALWKLDKRYFLCQTIHTAIACSLVIQHAYGTFETDAKVNLKVKLAIAAGNLIFSPIGIGSEMNYVLIGLPVLEAKKAESLCASGEVKVTPTAWGHCYSRNYVHHIDDHGHVTIKAILYDPHETNVNKPFLGFPAMLRRVNKPQTTLNDLSDSLFDPTKKLSNIEILKREELLGLRKTIILGEERNIGSEIRKFMIRPVLTQIDAHQPLEYLTEMRQVSVMFVTLKPKDCPFSQVINIVDNSYKITCEIVYKSMGCVNKIILFDKDVMILVIFGLRGYKHESEAQATLKCSYNVKKLLSALDGVLEVSIGVTTGKVYCGVVGHPLRREFTVIGAAVNKAARFMCTYRNKITCDETTYLNSKLSGNGFTLQPPIAMKGIVDPGKIYEYNEDIRLKQMFDIAIIPTLLNREDEMSYFTSWLNNNRRSTYRDFDALLLIGECRVGKTRLLEWMLRHAKNNEKNVCCISLTSIHASTPYLAISQIMNQLLGLNEILYEFEKEKKIVNILNYYSDDLCYLNNVLKVRFAYHESSNDTSEEERLEKAKHMFRRILKSLPQTYAIFIDDLQNLDDLSWEFISLLLDEIKIYSILTVTRGKFQAIKSWFYAVYMKSNIQKIVLKPLDNQWIPALACQILDVIGVPKELCNALTSKCNGMPGQVETFLMHLFSCGALDLKRINKEELPSYNEELHFPKPAQIQFVALDSKDQPSLDQALSENHSDQASVCILKNKDDLNAELNEINFDALIMIQLDSLTPYQQLLLKIASVIGNVFSRDLLENIMYENDPIATAKAIKRLFSMRIISCANIKRKQHITFRESTPLGSFKESPTCECGFEHDPDQYENLPKYALCKVMKFKNKNSSRTFYELLPLNQKKEFHTRIVNYLENNKHKCHSCGGSITIVQSIIGLENVKNTPTKTTSLNKDGNCNSGKEKRILNTSSSTSNNAIELKNPNLTTDSDDVSSNEGAQHLNDTNLMFVNIREIIEAKTSADWESIGIVDREDNFNENKKNCIPPGLKLERGISRTDFKKCTCSELSIAVYEQLIYHAKEAELKIKVIDFLIKFSYLNILAHNSDSKVMIKLNEAESICIDKSTNYLSKYQRKLYLGKIYTLKANANLLARKLMAAKIYIDKALKIYGFDVNKVKKILNIKSIIDHIKSKRRKYRSQSDELKSDSILCFNVATALYSAINDETSAKALVQRALHLSHTVTCNVVDICNAFYNFIEVEIPELANSSLNIEKLACMTFSMIPNAIQPEELYAVGKLFMAHFKAHTAKANIPVAIRYGYQALALSQFLYVVDISIDMIPNIFYLLLSRCRIKEAVAVVKTLLQMDCPEEWLECQIWYYALCMDIILDAGLQIETPEKIDDFAVLNLQKRTFSGACRRRLILNLWTYWLRTDESKAKRFENEALTIISRQTDDNSLKTLISAMRLAEGMLESLARKVGDLCKVVDLMELRSLAEKELNEMEGDVLSMRTILPRWILLKAYSLVLSGRHAAANSLFLQAIEEARHSKNRLEEALARAATSNSLIWIQNAVHGTFYNWEDDSLQAFSGYLVVENGRIREVGKQEDFVKTEWVDYEMIHLKPHQFLMPGFVDCHTHAPQYPNIGLGLDLPLLEWLDKYTFPLEKKYEDTQFAAKVYDRVVRKLLDNGTTTACYFGSLHVEGTEELAKSAIKHNQRAFIGKVSMDVENDTGYFNDTQTELADVNMFVRKILDYKNELVQPIITPRFALSCSKELMTGLAALAKKYDCPIQTHVSENKKEIEHVLNTFPNCSSYSEVYDRCNILTNRCIMAHGVWLSGAEMSLLRDRRASVAHCPASNTRLRSGLCPVRQLVEHGVTVGLGTDVSGGDSVSILDAMRRAMDVSTHLEIVDGRERALDWKEAFYLATRGGARALNLDHRVGCFESSLDFDALVIDVYTNGQVDKFDYPMTTGEEYILQLLQKFIYVGDDRNIVQVYVRGKKVKDITTTTT